MKKICFFGDSFTHGIGDETGRGWVGRLAEAEFREGRAFFAFNLGMPRETSPDLLARWRAEAGRRLDGHGLRSIGVVFCMGLDDMADLNDEGIRVDLPHAMGTAETLVGEAAALYPCLWIGPPPARSEGTLLSEEGGRVRYRKDRLAALNLAYHSIAADLRVPYLDLHADAEVEGAVRRAGQITGGVHAAVAERLRRWLSWRRWFDLNLSDPTPAPKTRGTGFQPLDMGGGLMG